MQQNVVSMFAKFDQDGTGFVERSFIEVAMQALNPVFTDAQLDHMLRRAGLPEDASTVNYRIFLRWVFSGQAWNGADGLQKTHRPKRGRAYRQRGRRFRQQAARQASQPEPAVEKADDKDQPASAVTKGGKAGVAAEKVVDEKQLASVIKEGGKRGVDIAGAAEMGGLQFFCTYVLEPDGDLDLLLESLNAMNAERAAAGSDEPCGGSGHVGKMLFSAGKEQLAIATFVPEARCCDISCAEWLEAVLRAYNGEILSNAENICTGRILADSANGLSPLKIRDPLIVEANNFLRARGLFPQEDDDDDSDILYGDDDFPC